MSPVPHTKTLSPSRSLPSSGLPPCNKPASTAPPQILTPAPPAQPFERSSGLLPSKTPFLFPDRTVAISALLPANAPAPPSLARHRRVQAARPLPPPASQSH